MDLRELLGRRRILLPPLALLPLSRVQFGVALRLGIVLDRVSSEWALLLGQDKTCQVGSK